MLDTYGERLLDDIALSAELGVQRVRLDVPWAATQLRAGSWDGDVIERVHHAAEVARSRGLAPWFRLLQPAVPHWFDNEGGFTDARTAAAWWPRWVELAADRFGDVAAGWIPFEAPFAMSNRLIPDDPRTHGELVHHLVVAWRDAWRILHGVHPVATSLDVGIERPDDPSPAAAAEARRREQLRWTMWLDAFDDGIVRIPGRADRELADLAGSCDIVGLALRRDVETCLYRTGERSPERPIAVTFRPIGDTDGERAQSIEGMWREVRRAADQLRIDAVTITPFADTADAPGIVTADRELKDSGNAFVTTD